jgi:hypothetical protein
MGHEALMVTKNLGRLTIETLKKLFLVSYEQEIEEAGPVAQQG